MFRITHGKGFHIQFENGWVVSVQFGPGNYGDNYNAPINSESEAECGAAGSSKAEVWAWYARAGKSGPHYPTDVLSWQTPNQVLAFMNKVAAFGDEPDEALREAE